MDDREQEEYDLKLQQLEGDERFLFLIANGVGIMNAGYSCGWTPAKTRRRLKDPEFRVLVEDAEEMDAEQYEMALKRRAKAGNVPALQLLLQSKYSHRGWVPPATKVTHEVGGKVDVNIKATVLEAVRERIAAGSIAELQGPIEDGEIVGDS